MSPRYNIFPLPGQEGEGGPDGPHGDWSKGLVNTLLESEYCEHSDIKGWVVVRWQEKKDQMNSPSTS